MSGAGDPLVPALKEDGQLPDGTNVILVIQISVWDNIFGPRVEKAYAGDGAHNLLSNTDAASMHIARHSLAGDVFVTKETSEIESKFHVFPELDLIATALIFTAKYQGSLAKFSLALVVGKKHLERYLVLHELVEDRMKHLVGQLRAMLNQKPRVAQTRFRELLPAFTGNLEALFLSTLPCPCFEGTSFWKADDNSLPFLARVVTSLLQTHCCAVVSGQDIEAVNAMIDTFSIFLSPAERMRSAYAHPDRQEFVPDLFLQGFRVAQFPDETIIQSRLPVTHVDIDSRTVSQTRPFHEYTLLRTEYLAAEVERLVDVAVKGDLWGEHDRLFREVTAPAPMVLRLMEETFSLPPAVRHAHLEDSMRQFARRSVVLIKYLEAELKQASSLEAGAIKRLREDVAIPDDGDYAILLAMAEKLEPGTYVALAGDPLQIEERFVELFESF